MMNMNKYLDEYQINRESKKCWQNPDRYKNAHAREAEAWIIVTALISVGMKC